MNHCFRILDFGFIGFKMEHCFRILLISLICVSTITTQLTVEKEVIFPLGCTLRQYNYTAKAVDENGKRCRARISTKACFGSCETFEYGTHEFPFIISVSPTCNYESVKEISISMTECELGASPTIQTYKYFEAISCLCKDLHPTEEGHKTIPTKRDELLYHDDYTRSGHDSRKHEINMNYFLTEDI